MMQTSEHTDYIFPAYVAFQAELEDPDPNRKGEISGTAKRSQKEYSIQWPYTDLRGLTTHTRQLLASHGLAVLQDLTSDESHIGTGTLLVHDSGQWIYFPPAMVPSAGGATDWSAAATLARRLSLMAALNLAPPSEDSSTGRGNGSGRGRSKSGASKLAGTKAVNELVEKAGAIGVSAESLLEALRSRPEGYTAASLSGMTTDDIAWSEAFLSGIDPQTGEVGDEPPGMDAKQYRERRQTQRDESSERLC